MEQFALGALACLALVILSAQLDREENFAALRLRDWVFRWKAIQGVVLFLLFWGIVCGLGFELLAAQLESALRAAGADLPADWLGSRREGPLMVAFLLPLIVKWTKDRAPGWLLKALGPVTQIAQWIDEMTITAFGESIRAEYARRSGFTATTRRGQVALLQLVASHPVELAQTQLKRLIRVRKLTREDPDVLDMLTAHVKQLRGKRSDQYRVRSAARMWGWYVFREKYDSKVRELRGADEAELEALAGDALASLKSLSASDVISLGL